LSAFEDTVYQAANSTAPATHEASSTVNEAPEMQSDVSNSVEAAAPEQPEPVQEETVGAQPSAPVHESMPQPVVQETANQSNQLDIF